MQPRKILKNERRPPIDQVRISSHTVGRVHEEYRCIPGDRNTRVEHPLLDEVGREQSRTSVVITGGGGKTATGPSELQTFREIEMGSGPEMWLR